MIKIKDIHKYKGRMASDVAKELRMDIDDFLDDIWDRGYYVCSKCGLVVNEYELDELDDPCYKCRENKMENTVIITDCYGIVVNLFDPSLHALTPTTYGGGDITSDLHEDYPLVDDTTPEAKKETEIEIDLYNSAMDGMESMILGHAIAGIDITTPAYKEGIESAVQGCANNI